MESVEFWESVLCTYESIENCPSDVEQGDFCLDNEDLAALALIKGSSPERQAAAFAVLTGGIDALYTEPTYKDPRDKELWAAKDKGNFAEWKAWVKPEFIEKGGQDES